MKKKSMLVQALGYGLAGAAAAALASETSRWSRPRYSPLSFLSGRKRSQSQFKRTLANAMSSTPFISELVNGKNFSGGRRSRGGDLLRSALIGFSAGVGSLTNPHGHWRSRGGQRGGWGGNRNERGRSGLAPILAGGLVAAAASQLLNRTLWDRRRDHRLDESESHSHETRHGRYRQFMERPNA